jgi:pterin-4a-carbinolamine dehydratase
MKCPPTSHCAIGESVFQETDNFIRHLTSAHQQSNQNLPQLFVFVFFSRTFNIMGSLAPFAHHRKQHPQLTKRFSPALLQTFLKSRKVGFLLLIFFRPTGL